MLSAYSIIVATLPEPTERPPSRIKGAVLRDIFDTVILIFQGIFHFDYIVFPTFSNLCRQSVVNHYSSPGRLSVVAPFLYVTFASNGVTTPCKSINSATDSKTRFYNEEGPAYALNYL